MSVQVSSTAARLPAAADNNQQVNVGARHPQRVLRPVTYVTVMKSLEESLTAELLANGKSLQRVKNHRTALNGWLREFGLSDDSAIGAEMGSEFPSRLDAHIASLEGEGKTKQTIDDRKSMLGKFREAWLTFLRTEPAYRLEGDFGEALSALIEESGLSFCELGRRVGVTDHSLSYWCRGERMPRRTNFPVVERLEELFGVPYGALTAKLPKVLYGDCGALETGRTGYREHLKAALASPYYLKTLPPQAQAEWGRVLKFYTDSAWVRLHGLKRNSRWRVRESDGACPSGDRAYEIIRKFFGYLCLPEDEGSPASDGQGFHPGALTLALLSDSDAIYNYLQYKKERTYLKRYNSETRYVLEFCSTLLRPETGFLWQWPEVGMRLPTPVGAGDWAGWCERNRSVLRATIKELLKENEIQKTRDPFDVIRPIIVNNQHPLDVLFALADAYEADRPARNAPAVSKAFHYQYLLLVKFATLIPLRAYNFTIMTYKRDNTGKLYQKPDGSWWVRFDASDFKNHKGAAKDVDFDVPIHPSLWPYIEEFLSVHRKHLGGAGQCDYLFRPRRVVKGGSAVKPVPPWILSKHVFRITQQYISDCLGFCLHAFRHLVATEYIKNNPAGYAIAAAVLHDKEETVKKNYAWVVPADRFIFWNRYVDGLMEGYRSQYRAAA